jgi:hypothetical protein
MKKTQIFLFLGVAVMMALSPHVPAKRGFIPLGYHIEWLNGNNATVNKIIPKQKSKRILIKNNCCRIYYNEGKMSMIKTQNTEKTNENNNPVTTVNENFCSSTTTK